jgi:hypothetical protein
MEARSQSAAHQNEMNFIFNLNAFSWKKMKPTAPLLTAPLLELSQSQHFQCSSFFLSCNCSGSETARSCLICSSCSWLITNCWFSCTPGLSLLFQLKIRAAEAARSRRCDVLLTSIGFSDLAAASAALTVACASAVLVRHYDARTPPHDPWR